MAIIKKGAVEKGATQRNMIMTAQKMNKNGKDFVMIDAQMDMRDERTQQAKDTNPHLESHPFVTPTGETRTAHGRRYTVDQFDKMRAAGDFQQDKKDPTKFIGTLKADVMISKKTDEKTGKTHSGLVIRTDKPMNKSDFGKPTQKVFKEQAAMVADMSAKVKAEREAAEQQIQAEAQAQASAPAVEAEEAMEVELN